MVTSDHNPIDIENKKLELENSLFGSIGLESWSNNRQATAPGSLPLPPTVTRAVVKKAEAFYHAILLENLTVFHDETDVS